MYAAITSASASTFSDGLGCGLGRVLAAPAISFERGDDASWQQALSLFDRVLVTPWQSLRWWLRPGARPRLQPLPGRSEASDLDGHYSGLQTVPVRRIVGSEGRTADFDARFRPLHQRFRDRWVSVAAARLRGLRLPPVELIAIGAHYYVRDGHHRISVALALGEEFIEANVTAW